MNARHDATRRSFLRWGAASGVMMWNPVGLRAGDAQQSPQSAGTLMKVDGRARVPAPDAFTQVLPLDGSDWQIAVDRENRGREQGWATAPPKQAKPARVPGVIQDAFPNDHGVAWYWLEFVAPQIPSTACRYLLRFHAVDYLAEVWVNGERQGQHEGGETPFVLDVTHAIKAAQTNRLAVRVLNPTNEPIDGYTLRETPAAYKMYPVQSNSVYNSGGIVDSVELLVAPVARIEDLHLLPDWQTGRIQVRANLRNAGDTPLPCWLQVTAAPATGGESAAGGTYRCEVPPGDTLVETSLAVAQHRLWELADPFLYRVTATLLQDDTRFADERSARCGFRDFRFENGYFRFNGRRIFLHGMVCQAHYPAGYTVPGDPAMMQRDVLHLKALGFNACRLTFGGSLARQLDLFDEMGILVYHEHYGSDMFYGSGILPKPPDFALMKGRFTNSVEEIVRRGRNHPSVVAWGLLNETGHKELLAHATATLPLVRSLDPTRMVILNSGGGAHSRMSNPRAASWQTAFSDEHKYPVVPYTADIIQGLRTAFVPRTGAGAGNAHTDLPVFLSEYGVSGAVHLPRLLRHYEHQGKEKADDARYYRAQFERFLADWKTFRLDECWGDLEDYFAESQHNMGRLRQSGINAIRANARIIGHLSTNTVSDQFFWGAGAANAFRELKPGLADAFRDMTAPLRWSLFVEPVNVYRGTRVKLEAVLSNHDVLKPGQYPARFQILSHEGRRVWDKEGVVQVPGADAGAEPPLAINVLCEDLPPDFAAGAYRFVASLGPGAAPARGETRFFVTEPGDMPDVRTEVSLWGEDGPVQAWLTGHGIHVCCFDASATAPDAVILVLGKAPAPGGEQAFSALAQHIRRGATAVFLDPRVFAEGKDATRWLSLIGKGRLESLGLVGGYYRPDDWAKRHPIFEGLSAGGIMDYTFYRDLIPVQGFTGLEPPEEAVCGAVRVSGGSLQRDYASGLHLSVHRLGAGRLILNTLHIRDNLGKVPAAERLFRNMLRYAAAPKK